MSKGEPDRSLYEREAVPARVGTKFVYHKGGKVIDERWWSTGDEEQMKNAVLLLLETEVGFAVKVIGPSFVEKGAIDHDSTLEIRRTGYGAGGLGPKDYWHVFYEGEQIGAAFSNPEEAVDFFFKVREEKELGHDMADRGFSGHGCPSRVLKEMDEEEEKEPQPDPIYDRGQWVFKNGAVGIVVAVDGDEGIPKSNYAGRWIGVWFGSQDRVEICPAGAVKPVKPPPFHNGYFMGMEELLGKGKRDDSGESV